MIYSLLGHAIFVAQSLDDSSDVFNIVAESELLAKSQLLEKLGFEIVFKHNKFKLRDLDSDNPDVILSAPTLPAAQDDVLLMHRWKIMPQ